MEGCATNRELGLLNLVRWLTGAKKFLRLYIGTNRLKIIVNFVMKVYDHLWFVIKNSPSCKNSAKRNFETMAVTDICQKIKKLVEPVIQKISYYV